MEAETIIEAGNILRTFLVAGGAFLLLITISSLANKRLNENFALLWGVLSVIFIVTGLYIRPVMLHSYISPAGLALIMLAVAVVMGSFFFLSVRASEMARKNTELAIDVSILHQQVDEMSEIIDELKRNAEKDEVKEQS